MGIWARISPFRHRWTSLTLSPQSECASVSPFQGGRPLSGAVGCCRLLSAAVLERRRMGAVAADNGGGCRSLPPLSWKFQQLSAGVVLSQLNHDSCDWVFEGRSVHRSTFWVQPLHGFVHEEPTGNRRTLSFGDRSTTTSFGDRRTTTSFGDQSITGECFAAWARRAT
jgi:hypothetical protein